MMDGLQDPDSMFARKKRALEAVGAGHEKSYQIRKIVPSDMKQWASLPIIWPDTGQADLSEKHFCKRSSRNPPSRARIGIDHKPNFRNLNIKCRRPSSIWARHTINRYVLD